MLPGRAFELPLAHRNSGFNNQACGGAFKNYRVHKLCLDKESFRFFALAGSPAGGLMETPTAIGLRNWTIVLVRRVDRCLMTLA